MTSKELEKKSEEYFKQYPDIDVFYATEDGQFFQDRNVAASHKTTAGGQMHTLKRSKINVPKEPAKNEDDTSLEELQASYKELTGSELDPRIKNIDTAKKKVEDAQKAKEDETKLEEYRQEYYDITGEELNPQITSLETAQQKIEEAKKDK